MKCSLVRQAEFVRERATAEEERAFVEALLLPDGDLVECLESHFFIVSLRHVLLWLEHLPTTRGIPTHVSTAARAFEAAMPHAKDLRDMLEHEDEYLSGGGRKKDDYYVHGLLTMSAHSVAPVGASYLIGGRVQVGYTLPALEKLAPVLLAARGPVAPMTFEVTVTSD